MKGIRRIALGVVVLSAVAGNVFAQGYPMPYKKGTTAVTCPVTVCPRTPGLPLYPFDSPMNRFVGRYVDSTLTRDYQAPLRTYRARGFRYSPERGKLYMMLGSTFAAYDFAKMTTTLTPTGSHLQGSGVRREGLPPETHLPPDGFVYPETGGSGWTTPIRDGQDRLNDFDWDDRGYNYLAYTIFGWGIVKDGDGRMGLTKQVLGDSSTSAGASMILAVKAGSKYYVLVGAGGATFGVWDVTNPSSPTFVRFISKSVISWGRTNSSGQQVVALGLADNSVQLFKAETLVAGGAAEATFPATLRRTGISAEGSTLYVSTGLGARTGYVSVLKGNPSSPASYTETKLELETGFYPAGINVHNGMLSVWSAKDVRVYRVLSSGLESIPLGNYFYKAYTTGEANYAKPDGYTAEVKGSAVIRAGGKDYLVYAGNGIGDVYEIQSRDTVSVSSRTVGTKNPFSANRDGGPYYSDPIEFTLGASVPTRVSILFDNPESAENRIDVTTPATVLHQYQAVNPQAPTEIGRSRDVAVSAFGDPSNSDSLSLNLLVPAAAVSLRSGATTTPLAANSSVKAMFGDEVLDASDGRIEGHYSAWSLDSVVTNHSPDTPLQLGGCGARTLALESHYTPYTGSGTSVTPTLTLTKHFVRSVSGISIEVRPFVATLGTPVRNGDGSVTFSSATRFSSALVSSGEATFTWKLLPAAGDTAILQQSGSVVIGSAASDPDGKFTVPAAELATGRRVILEVSTAAFSPNATGCSTYATSVTPAFIMRVPDPKITVTNCDSVGSLDSCRLVASSISGDMTGWTYTWKIDGAALVTNSATASTLDPKSKFTTSKTYSIELIATNVMGQVSATTSHFVDKSACDGPPKNVAFSFSGTVSGCQYSDCTELEPFQFNPTAFGYLYQECDRFAWTFGSAGTSNVKSPTFSFPSNGTYEVKLKVTNDNGSMEFKRTFTFGPVAPPPPPPPPPASCIAPKNTTVFPKYTGTTTGCSSSKPGCYTGENVSFQIETFGYTIKSTCDTFTWNFGDGHSATSQNASHAYAQPGTYNGSMTIRNNAGSVTKPMTITVVPAQVVCNAISSRAIPDLSWSAPSGCSKNSGGVCQPGETVRLTATPSFYTLQSCDIVEWNFGDGSPNASGPAVDHVFPLTNDQFEVTVSIRNSTSTTPITGKRAVKFQGGAGVDPPTNAQINAETNSYVANSPIQFVGSALGTVPETTWLWEFGDGSQSTAQNPTKTYAQPGPYTVKLTVKNGTFTSQWAITTKSIVVTAGKAFRFLLPAVIHAKLPGDGGSWMTDLQIYNPDPAFTPTKPLSLKFESTFAAPYVKSMDTSTYVQEDLMSLLTATNNTQGAVIISGVATEEKTVPQMWTRTYLQSSNGIGGYGQLVPAIRLDTQQSATTGARQYVIAGLKSDPRSVGGFRTNIGVANPTADAVTVAMRIFDNTDVLLFKQEVLEIPAYSVNQVSVQGPENETFTVRIVSESGAPVFAYASMVDNVSNDPIFIEALQDNANSDAAYSAQVLPGIGRLSKDSWKSDVTIYNPESNGVQFDLAFYDGVTGNKLAEAKDVTLGGNKFLQARDLISAGILTPSISGDAYGTLRIETKTPNLARYPLAYARTYSDQAASGTFGQGIPAFAAQKANVKAGKPAIIAGVRNSGFKSNVGIVSTSDETSAVLITLLDAMTGQPLGQPVSVGIVPHGSSMIPVFAAAFPADQPTTASRASVKIELLSGPPVWAFASIVDSTTKDPEYVPAIPLR